MREFWQLTNFCVSFQLAQLQVEMGAPKRAVKPDIATQEYNDVGLCPSQCPLCPWFLTPLMQLSLQSNLFSVANSEPTSSLPPC